MSNLDQKKKFLKTNLLELILSIPKTIFFNFKVLPIKNAIKIPCVVSYKVKLRGINKNSFIFEKLPSQTGSIRIGFGKSASGERETKKSLLSITNGKIIVKDVIGLSQGCVFVVNDSTLFLGKNFRCNYSATIVSTNSNITIGDNVVLGWNVTIRNIDGHFIIDDGIEKQNHAPITIGDHTWICAKATILKGINIGKNNVIAYGSLLTKSSGENNVIYGGTPASIIKKHINWRE
ncbi:acyltransferase [Enterococcus mundtii]|uniref:acyltransferase n=1 Tax=Enterococcus mundtii TaxID=53346 RepID=UPI0032DE720A